MNKLSLLYKIIYIISVITCTSSIALSFLQKKYPTWEIITLIWICASFVNELRIKKLEKSINDKDKQTHSG